MSNIEWKWSLEIGCWVGVHLARGFTVGVIQCLEEKDDPGMWNWYFCLQDDVAVGLGCLVEIAEKVTSLDAELEAQGLLSKSVQEVSIGELT